MCKALVVHFYKPGIHMLASTDVCVVSLTAYSFIYIYIYASFVIAYHAHKFITTMICFLFTLLCSYVLCAYIFIQLQRCIECVMQTLLLVIP